MERKICIQPRTVDNGLKGPHPFFITVDGLVGEQERWEGAPTLLEGFVYDPSTTGTVDLDFEDFWADPALCLGMHPVFTHDEGDGDSIFTHGDKTITHVSITDGDHVIGRFSAPYQEDGPVDLNGEPIDQGVTMPRALYKKMRDKASEYDLMMDDETSGRMVRIPRRDYVTLLDRALVLANLRHGEDVDIDGRLYKLVDANTQPEGSAALMLTSLARGTKVTVNGAEHKLVDVETLKELTSDSGFLAELYAAGVGNWDGYSIAREAYGDVDEEGES